MLRCQVAFLWAGGGVYFRLNQVSLVSAVAQLAVLQSRCSVAWDAVSRWQHSANSDHLRLQKIAKPVTASME